MSMNLLQSTTLGQRRAGLLGGVSLFAAFCFGAVVPAISDPQTPLPRPAHIVIVIEENKGYSQIIGSRDAPYINGLAQQGALFTNSHGLTHPSQPNYFDLFAGSDFGVHDNNTPKRPLPGPSLGGELKAVGLRFRGYAEDLPGVGATDGTAGKYARKHCPWVSFQDVSPTDSVPFYEDGSLNNFPTDAAGFDRLPTVSFVVPNLDNDMHDGSIKQGDGWLQAHLSDYAQWAKTHNSLLILTFDEDNTKAIQPNTIPTIFYGGDVKPGEYSEEITHYSVLRTIEQMYDLPQAGQSSAADPITDIWDSSAPQQAAAPAMSSEGGTQPQG